MIPLEPTTTKKKKVMSGSKKREDGDDDETFDRRVADALCMRTVSEKEVKSMK